MEINVCMGVRLKEIREALALSQTEFAQIAGNAGVPGATRQSQAKYEKGLATPSAAYLAAIAAAGADVLYILTGQRTEGTASDPAEQVLLDSYRRCKPDAKANLIQMAALLSAGVAPGPAPKAAPRTRAGSGVQMSASAQPSIAVRGSRNVVAGRDVVQTKARK